MLLDLLDSIPSNTNVAARASHIISSISKNRGDTESHLYYLAKSAVADIQSATREMVSLQELGIALYGRQEIERAYEYLSVALAYAVECNASMRMLQTSEARPVITAAHRDSLALNRHRLYFAIGAMALLLIRRNHDTCEIAQGDDPHGETSAGACQCESCQGDVHESVPKPVYNLYEQA